MESMQKLAKELDKIHKDLPHLPKGGQRWLAQNVWWLVLICVTLGAIGVLATISGMAIVGGSLALLAGPIGAAVGGWLFLLTVLSLGVSIAVLVISAMAIAPLKHQEAKGWELLLLGITINVVASVVIAVLSFNMGMLLWALLVSAVVVYFLFEMRQQYGSRAKKNKSKEEKGKQV